MQRTLSDGHVQNTSNVDCSHYNVDRGEAHLKGLQQNIDSGTISNKQMYERGAELQLSKIIKMFI
jgi:hypothetical protein